MARISKQIWLTLSATVAMFFNMIPLTSAQMGQSLDNFLEYENIKIQSFDKFFDWFGKISPSLYVRNMQHSTSPRGDASFFSFNMMAIPRAKQVDFMGSGITINFQPLADKSKSWPKVSAQLRYGASAYLSNFPLQNVDPVNLKTLFQYGLETFKMTSPEVVAHIVNTFDFYSNRFKDRRFHKGYVEGPETRIRYALQPLLDRMKKQYGIEIKHYPSQSAFCAGYAQDIELQTKQHYSVVIFDLVIKGKTNQETLDNFNTFFRAAGSSAEDLLNLFRPEGQINISDQVFSLDFDKNIFYRTDKQGKKLEVTEKVSLFPRSFTYKYAYSKKGWQLILEFTEFEKKGDYNFLFTDFVKLNPSAFAHQKYKEENMYRYVVEYDKINQMKIIISKDSVTGDMIYNKTNFYQFMNKMIP